MQRGEPTIPNTKILIVDDHPLVRERLREVLEAETGFTVCGEAEERNQALALIDTTKPTLVIVDLTLKASHGLDLIKDIRVRYPKLLILVVSMHDESLYAERAIRAGAHGYITKQEATTKVVQAIRKVLAGDTFLSERMASRLLGQIAHGYKPGLEPPLEKLTDRELQVLTLIGQGHGTRQIASDLHLDMKTIETYRARLKEKLNLPDADALLQHAIAWVHGTDTP